MISVDSCTRTTQVSGVRMFIKKTLKIFLLLIFVGETFSCKRREPDIAFLLVNVDVNELTTTTTDESTSPTTTGASILFDPTLLEILDEVHEDSDDLDPKLREILDEVHEDSDELDPKLLEILDEVHAGVEDVQDKLDINRSRLAKSLNWFPSDIPEDADQEELDDDIHYQDGYHRSLDQIWKDLITARDQLYSLRGPARLVHDHEARTSYSCGGIHGWHPKCGARQ